MPRDLFGTVASRPRSTRSRRASVASVVVHTFVVSAALVFSLVESDKLPMPHQALAYFEAAMPIADVKLPSPPPPRRANAPVDPAMPDVSPNAAPAFAPEGITPETGIEDTVSMQHGVGIVGLGDPAGTLVGSARLEEPPAPPPPTEPIRMHSGIRGPLKVTHVAPTYPAIAQRARVEGIVIIEATIDAQGSVVSAKVLRSIPLLDDAAIEAVGQWKFTPALLNGGPVPVIMTVTVRFTLQ